MIKHLKKSIELIFALIYAVYLSVMRKGPSCVVLYYHSVNKADIRNFEKQMSCLRDNFTVVKPSEILSTRNQNNSAIVAITFDDAFVNIAENAVPILKKYGLSAGIFVPAAKMGHRPDWEIMENCHDHNELVMNRKQIAELDGKGFEINSHTLSHPKLVELEDAQQLSELKVSKQVLERLIGHEVLAISYPYGIHNERVCRNAKKCGYHLGFTIEPHMVTRSTNSLQIGRFSVLPEDSLFMFKLKVRGAYQSVKILRVGKKLVTRFFGKCDSK